MESHPLRNIKLRRDRIVPNFDRICNQSVRGFGESKKHRDPELGDGAYTMSAAGLTTISSSFSPKDTADQLEAEIKAKGMTVFANRSHGGAAR